MAATLCAARGTSGVGAAARAQRLASRTRPCCSGCTPQPGHAQGGPKVRRHHSLPQSLLPPLLRQFVRVAVVAAAIAAAAAAATAPRPAPDCSRQLSREVRDIVAREVLPVMKLHGVTYAPACVFNVDRDMYAEQAASKTVTRKDLHQCTLCSKMFRTEYYLDLHLDRRHVVNATDGLCLADACPFLGCPSYVPGDATSKSTGFAPEHRRHLCTAMLHKCFPPDRLTSNQAAVVGSLAHLCAPRAPASRISASTRAWLLYGSLAVGFAVYYTCLLDHRRRAARAQRDLLVPRPSWWRQCQRRWCSRLLRAKPD